MSSSLMFVTTGDAPVIPASYSRMDSEPLLAHTVAEMERAILSSGISSLAVAGPKSSPSAVAPGESSCHASADTRYTWPTVNPVRLRRISPLGRGVPMTLSKNASFNQAAFNAPLGKMVAPVGVTR
ncbi:hypothetical protein D3C71_1651980 [compost metagenome]